MGFHLRSSKLEKIYLGSREVKKIYIGPAEIYRRLWTPAQITTLAWYDAADVSTVDLCLGTNKVCVWNDKSGNGHHATQSNASRQPVFVPGLQNYRGGDTV